MTNQPPDTSPDPAEQPDPADISQMLDEAEEVLRQRAILGDFVASLVADFDPGTDKDPWAVATQNLFSTNGQPTGTKIIDMNDLYGQVLDDEYDALATVVFSPKRFSGSDSDRVPDGWHGMGVSRSGELVRTQPGTGEIGLDAGELSAASHNITGFEDVLLRAFQLPTRPPFISFPDWLTKLWVFTIADDMLRPGETLQWDRAANMHGAMILWNEVPEGEWPDTLQVNRSALQPQDLHALTAELNQVSGWEYWHKSRLFLFRENIHDRLADALGLRPHLYAWYDTGALSRYFDQMLDFAHGGLSSWISIIGKHWDEADVDRLWDTMELISTEVFGRRDQV